MISLNLYRLVLIKISFLHQYFVLTKCGTGQSRCDSWCCIDLVRSMLLSLYFMQLELRTCIEIFHDQYCLTFYCIVDTHQIYIQANFCYHPPTPANGGHLAHHLTESRPWAAPARPVLEIRNVTVFTLHKRMKER